MKDSTIITHESKKTHQGTKRTTIRENKRKRDKTGQGLVVGERLRVTKWFQTVPRKTQG